MSGHLLSVVQCLAAEPCRTHAHREPSCSPGAATRAAGVLVCLLAMRRAGLAAGTASAGTSSGAGPAFLPVRAAACEGCAAAAALRWARFGRLAACTATAWWLENVRTYCHKSCLYCILIDNTMCTVKPPHKLCN